MCLCVFILLLLFFRWKMTFFYQDYDSLLFCTTIIFCQQRHINRKKTWFNEDILAKENNYKYVIRYTFPTD